MKSKEEKTKEDLAASSRASLIASYLKETSTIDYSERDKMPLKELGKAMLANMEKLKEIGGFIWIKF